MNDVTVDGNRFSHEPVVIGLFAYASDARRAVVDLREQDFTSNQVAAAFRDAEPATAGTDISSPRTESSQWFGQLRQIYHGNESAQVPDTSTTGFEAMLAQLPISPEYARGLISNPDQGAAIVTVQAGPRNQEARALLEQRGAQITPSQTSVPVHGLQTAPPEAPAGTVTRSLPFIVPAAAEPGHIQLFGEVLNVRKEKVSSDVQVRKELVTRMETVQVPVTREELVVERPDDSGRIHPENAIRVPLNEERVHIDKETVLREEYKVGKREVTQNRSITDSVRRERLLIDEAKDSPSD